MNFLLFIEYLSENFVSLIVYLATKYAGTWLKPTTGFIALFGVYYTYHVKMSKKKQGTATYA